MSQLWMFGAIRLHRAAAWAIDGAINAVDDNPATIDRLEYVSRVSDILLSQKFVTLSKALDLG